MIDIGLYVSYLMTAAAVVLAIGFPVLYAVRNPAGVKRVAMTAVAMVLLFLVSWAVSSGEVLPAFSRFGVSSAESKFIGGGLIFMYLAFLSAVASVVYAEVRKAIR